MRIGRCPRCKFRMILVRVARCDCGLGHRRILQHPGECPAPYIQLRVRTHTCGRLLQPTEIEGMSA